MTNADDLKGHEARPASRLLVGTRYALGILDATREDTGDDGRYPGVGWL